MCKRIHQIIGIFWLAKEETLKCEELRINQPSWCRTVSGVHRDQSASQCMFVKFEFYNFKQLYFLTSNEGQSPGHWYNVSANNK